MDFWLIVAFSRTEDEKRSWGKYWLWQYTDNTKGIEPNQVPGIPGNSKGNLDCNSYDGTRAHLVAEWAS